MYRSPSHPGPSSPRLSTPGALEVFADRDQLRAAEELAVRPLADAAELARREAKRRKHEAKRAAKRARMASGETCRFFLSRKRRCCNGARLPGSDFCGAHAKEAGSAPRVPCPINPKHTVREDALRAHLLVCPDRAETKMPTDRPFHREGVNATSTVPAPVDDAAVLTPANVARVAAGRSRWR